MCIISRYVRKFDRTWERLMNYISYHFRSNIDFYYFTQRLLPTIKKLHKLRILDLEENLLEFLPPDIG